jgi:glycosyltransferase involved in cell wall biosynthesis
MTDDSKNSKRPKYSIVIPAYNESIRLPLTLASVVSCIRKRGWDAEIIVVDDGSTDGTADVVHKFANNTPEVWSAEKRLIVGQAIQSLPDEHRPVELRVLENPGNRGKGYSVRAGSGSLHRCRPLGAHRGGRTPL